MKTIALITIALSTLLACSKGSTLVPDDHIDSTMSAAPFSYLALGDSYTIGESVDQKDSFPYQLSAALHGAGLQNPTIIARTGWTADNLISAISTSGITDKKYNIVTLLIGVNDQYQGLSQTNYRTKFVQLLNTAINFANGNKTHVIVISIPDYGVTPFANGNDAVIGPQIDQFNAINKQESDKAGVQYVNITPISKQAATDPTLVAGDGLHPSAKMYSLWVGEISKVVGKLLK